MDDETVTPFAMWGAGVKKLEENFGARSHFDHFDGFNHIKRAEMNQADLAPLMSALVRSSMNLLRLQYKCFALLMRIEK